MLLERTAELRIGTDPRPELCLIVGPNPYAVFSLRMAES